MALAMAWPIILFAAFNDNIHLAECASLTGAVFDDLNQNGVREKGESGVRGVRIVTGSGHQVTTSKNGRYQVTCAAIPSRRGESELLLNLDIRTLPRGYKLRSRNPHLVRVAAGESTQIDFGISLDRLVVTARDEDFKAGRADLTAKAMGELEPLFPELRKKRREVLILYRGSDTKHARARAQHLRKTILERWRQRGKDYDLHIEISIQAAE
ncbi:hypothetical protein [Chelativorans sp. AA-79]|uniref:hypothetical protein n=1 Tax=Chelativorans sp. AA-79 TaxID=3028735 RepID=UPI0023F87789|nr:hypothetical protein [Chelativorans sp. AA-79]WEX07853.1 hypothetical protein PVE73_17365 [Chelativorans sp. AA-79]